MARSWPSAFAESFNVSDQDGVAIDNNETARDE